MGSVESLRTVMKVQSVAFFAYGAAFLLIPGVVIGTLFGYEVESFWPRAFGATFLGVAWAEWNVADRVQERLDLVWPFAFIAGLIAVVFLWELAAGTYPGTASFWWVNLIVATVFFVMVIAARPRPEATS